VGCGPRRQTEKEGVFLIMERSAANALRILGILATVILVILACYWPLVIAWVIVMMGGLTQRAMTFRPQAGSAFVAAILAVVVIVTVGVLIIRKLAAGIVLGTAGLPPLATASGVAVTTAATAKPGIASPSRTLPSVRFHLSPGARKTVDRLVLTLAAHVVVSAITFFQLASRPSLPRSWISMLLPLFILSEVPYAFLIYVLLKRPGRQAFTLLVAMLAIPILTPLSNPLILHSYRQIYTNHPIGVLWIALSGLIYVVTLVMAYRAIQQTGLRPKLSSVTLTTVAAFFYYAFFIRLTTPYLYNLWK
jgi:hypothetical protein